MAKAKRPSKRKLLPANVIILIPDMGLSESQVATLTEHFRAELLECLPEAHRGRDIEIIRFFEGPPPPGR